MIILSSPLNSKSKKLKIALCIISSIVIVVLSVLAYLYNSLGKFNTVKLPSSNEELGIGKVVSDDSKEETIENNEYLNGGTITGYESDNSILNIALFGIDTGREKTDPPHSDSIIIATIDKQHNKIKLTSIMRDTYVNVSRHGRTKINEAYTYGGSLLAIKTLNENFGLDIKNYVTVNFFSLEKIIDVLGGVEITIKDYETDEINKWIMEVADLEGKSPPIIWEPGTYRLNGLQAVAYSRMRKVGGGDFERSERQRRVLTELFKELQSKGIYKYPTIASEVFPLIETSLTKSDIINAGAFIVSSGISNIEQQRFPLDGYCKGEIINSTWYLVPKPNLSVTSKQLRDYIYEDIKPKSKQPLF